MKTMTLLLRTVGPHARPDPNVALKCETEGCNRSTREGKPFCVDHVQASPYVQRLLDTLAKHERELERVKRLGTRGVRLDGLMTQEIVHQLRTYGDRTVERLARDLAVDHTLIRAYATRMTRAGMTRQGQTVRGHACLTLLAVQSAHAGASPADPVSSRIDSAA